eukprot:1977959-Pleurochrysis_carterae.AAC.1
MDRDCARMLSVRALACAQPEIAGGTIPGRATHCRTKQNRATQGDAGQDNAGQGNAGPRRVTQSRAIGRLVRARACPNAHPEKKGEDEVG